MKVPVGPDDDKIYMDDGDVLFQNHGSCCTVTLNRPKKLNSLNVSMIEKMFRFYVTESKSPETNLFIQDSVIPKAFCAGGDVVVLAKADNAGFACHSIRLFEFEYSLNYFFSKFKKPVVSFMNGITMGGGVGVSVHSAFRVVTETTKLAMPEMLIGFFPDVGASFFFPRMDGYVGWHMCLVGDSLVGYNNVLFGTGTHFVPSGKLPELKQRLIEESAKFDFDVRSVKDHTSAWHLRVNQIIDEYTEVPKEFVPQYSIEDLKTIRDVYSNAKTVEQVFASFENLANNGNKFAQSVVEKFQVRSMISIKMCYALFQYSGRNTNYEALSKEFLLAKHLNTNHEAYDLSEGIFKKLVLKTNDPKFKYSSIYEVPDELVSDALNKPFPAFGHIIKFENNWALFPDSYDYYLRKFALPKFSDIEKLLSKGVKKSDVAAELRKEPQWASKKGIEGKVSLYFALKSNANL